MNLLILVTGALAIVAVAAHLASIAFILPRFRKRDCCVANDPPAVSILRPVCGLENFIEETLESTFLLDYPSYEIVFCVADKNDPVVPIVQKLIAAYPGIEARLLIGNATVSNNPKLNNLIKGWHGSRHEVVDHGRQQRPDAERLYPAHAFGLAG
jgi:ceramide glucosyltransferase